MSHEENSNDQTSQTGVSLASPLQTTASPSRTRSRSTAKDGSGPPTAVRSEAPRENERYRLVAELERVTESFRNEEFSKFEAYSKSLGLIQRADGLSESQKAQAFDSFSKEIHSADFQVKQAGKRAAPPTGSPQANEQLAPSPLVNDTKPVKRKRGNSERERFPSSSVDGENSQFGCDDERGNELQPSKRVKLQESDMPWYRQPTGGYRGSTFRTDPSCEITRRMLCKFSQDLSGAKNLVRFAEKTPDGLPSSQWDRILRGEAVDLNAILSNIHYTGAKRMVQTAADWTAAWGRASRAIRFLFPNRVDELDEYGEYIQGQFAARNPSLARSIILYDRAVRNLVEGGQRTLLTETHKFSYLYTAIVLPDGIDNGRSQRSRIRKQRWND